MLRLCCDASHGHLRVVLASIPRFGVLLGKLGSLRILVGKNELRNYRGASSKRTLITAVECISATGNCLHPLVIWPSATHRSHWTTRPTPGWHFAYTESGHTNNAINMH
jgi:hypothetical protein